MSKTIWRSVSAVLWAFLGIRKREEYEKDLETIKPTQVILTGIFLALIFVISLLVLVNIIIAV